MKNIMLGWIIMVVLMPFEANGQRLIMEPSTINEAQKFGELVLKHIQNNDAKQLNKLFDGSELAYRTTDIYSTGTQFSDSTYRLGISRAATFEKHITQLKPNGAETSFLGAHEYEGQIWIVFRFYLPPHLPVYSEFLVQHVPNSQNGGKNRVVITDIFSHNLGTNESALLSWIPKYVSKARGGTSSLSEEEITNFAYQMNQQDKSECYQICKKMDQQMRSEPIICVYCFQAARSQGNEEEGYTWYYDAIELRPEVFGRSMFLYNIQIQEKKYKSALETIEKIIERIEIPDGRLLLESSACYALIGDTANAISWIQKSIQDDPDYIGAYVLLLRYTAGQGDYQAANKTFALIVKKFRLQVDDLELKIDDIEDYLTSPQYQKMKSRIKGRT